MEYNYLNPFQYNSSNQYSNLCIDDYFKSMELENKLNQMIDLESNYIETIPFTIFNNIFSNENNYYTSNVFNEQNSRNLQEEKTFKILPPFSQASEMPVSIQEPAKKVMKLSNLDCIIGESLKNLPKEEINDLSLGKYLKIYQKRAVAQISRLRNGYILGFSMGLGKTLTMAAQCLEIFKTKQKPILLLTTKSTHIQTQEAFKEAFALNAFDEIDSKIIQPKKALSKFDAYFCYQQIVRFKRYVTNPEHNTTVEKLIQSFIDLHPECNFNGSVAKKNYSNHLLQNFPSFQIFNAIENEKDFDLNSLQNQQKVVFLTASELDKHLDALTKIKWAGIFVDEAQKINNPKTKFHKNIKVLKAASQAQLVLATGTPIENRLRDMSAFLTLLEPKVNPQMRENLEHPLHHIDEVFKMTQRKINGIAKKIHKYLSKRSQNLSIANELYSELRSLFIFMEGLKSIVSKACVRRTLNDKLVMDEWGDKIPQAKLIKKILSYDAFLSQQKSIDDIAKEYKTTKKEKGAFFRFLKQMSRAMIHADLIHSKSPQYKESWNKESSFLHYFATDQEFKDSMNDGTIIFVDQHVCGETIRNCLLNAHGISHIDFLTGDCTTEERNEIVQNFEKPLDGKPRVLILMIDAGGTGINLKKNGKTAIIATKKLNPKTEAQALSRILRAGSTKGLIEVIDLNSKTRYEKHTRYLQKRKLAIEKCLLPETSIKQAQDDNQKNACVNAFETLAKVIIMHLNYDFYSQHKSSLKNLLKQLTQIAEADSNLLYDALESDPLLKPVILKNLSQKSGAVSKTTPKTQPKKRKIHDEDHAESRPAKFQLLEPTPLQTIDELGQFLLKSGINQEFIKRSYFKVEATSPLFEPLHKLIGKNTFADIIPLQTDVKRGNLNLALGALEKMSQHSPNIINEQLTRIRRNPNVPLQARFNAHTLESNEPKLHAWLWKDIQKPVIEAKDDQIFERFKQAQHEIIIFDLKKQQAEPLFNIATPKKVSYLARFSDQQRQHYDILYSNPTN